MKRKTNNGAVSEEIRGLASQVLVKRISKTLTSGDVAGTFSFTLGDDGQPLSGKRGLLLITVPSGASMGTGSVAYVTARINDIATGYVDSSAGSLNYSAFSIGAVRNIAARILVQLYISNSKFTWQSSCAYADTGAQSATQYIGCNGNVGMAITKVYFTLSGSYTLPTGTVIEYWEASD